MSGSVVYLFVDTNLLFQCRPLEELDWSAWNEFDEVRLIVSKPVLREIDYRKNKGNDRVGKRARDASAMFRKMLNDGDKVIHDSDPCVKLSVEPQHQYTKELEDQLNLQERDDQLIATAYEFAEHHPSDEVRLLTHDTTPLYTAQGLGLVADVIPDAWLLPPEKTESEKELAALKAENVRLKKAEPSFVIRCLSSTGTEVERYEISCPRFKPLTAAETTSLTQRLNERFPLETDFGPRKKSTERNALKIHIQQILGRVFIPATDEAITKYRDEAYPQWLAQCEESLRNYHRTLQGQEPMPRFLFRAENRGTRPATDARITIEAQGGFQIKLLKPPTQDDESNSEEKLTALLSSPPSAPCGRWETANSLVNSFANRPLYYPELVQPLSYSSPDLSRLPWRRDPNTFYYKTDRPRTPQYTFCLECDQWRHEDGEVDFEGEIYLPADRNMGKGALICRIQAGNLSKSEYKLIPVRITTTALVNTFARASAAVEALAEHSERSDIERPGEA